MWDAAASCMDFYVQRRKFPLLYHKFSYWIAISNMLSSWLLWLILNVQTHCDIFVIGYIHKDYGSLLWPAVHAIRNKKYLAIVDTICCMSLVLYLNHIAG